MGFNGLQRSSMGFGDWHLNVKWGNADVTVTAKTVIVSVEAVAE